MKLIFIIIGIIFSATSKVLQIKGKTLEGNIFILPAGVFFTLAILWSIPSFIMKFNNPDLNSKVLFFTVSVCFSVTLLQLFIMTLVNKQFIYCISAFILFCCFAGGATMLWKSF